MATRSRTGTRVGVYPGTFNPPTVAHLAIARAALDQRGLTKVVFALSVSPIDKEHVELPRLEDRLAVLRDEAASSGGWLEVVLTEHRLLVDIARGYDVLIMGADKWMQVNDPRYYGDASARDAALAALPELAIAPRPPIAIPEEHALVVDADHADVSSSAVRAGARDWMSPAAATFDERTGAWSDPERYEAWLRSSIG
jgi:nicotinamide-nucleotide adenylyltransferase